jgi:hypothetical protein
VLQKSLFDRQSNLFSAGKCLIDLGSVVAHPQFLNNAIKSESPGGVFHSAVERKPVMLQK